MLNSEDLINKVKVYNKFLNPEKLNKAYDFAVKAHGNQKRASGDPYSVHPIEVAKIVAKDIGLDYISIASALLHDVVEDTDVTFKDLNESVGHEISRIVNGLTKISTLKKNEDYSCLLYTSDAADES